MDAVMSMRSIPVKKERRADSISLVLAPNEILNESEENDHSGMVWIKKERCNQWKERNLILFDKKCLVVLGGFDQRPENIFFLDACTVTQQNPTTFLLQDHVRKSDYIIQLPPKNNNDNLVNINNSNTIRINESLESSTNTLFTHNHTNTDENNCKLPPVLESLKTFCEGSSLNTSGNFELKETTSFLKQPCFDQDIKTFGLLPYVLKLTLSYPWNGVFSILPWIIRFVMFANLAALCYSFVEPWSGSNFAWNFPVLVYTAFSIYNHYWITKTLKSRHFEYLISVTIARRRYLGMLKKFTILGILAIVAIDLIFLAAMLVSILFQPWELAGLLSIVSTLILFWLHLPSTVISFIIFAFITRMHRFSLANISTLAKRMVSLDTLELPTLYVHLLYQNILIQKTAKRSVGTFLGLFMVFTFFFVLGIFRITRLSLPQDLADFLISIMEIVLSFLILLLSTLPVSSLNAVCDQIFRQILFLSNFNKLLSQNPDTNLDNIEEGLNRSNLSKNVNITQTLEFSLMVEKMSLGFVVFGVRITFNWVFSILYIFGGIAVFIMAQSSLFKSS